MRLHLEPENCLPKSLEWPISRTHSLSDTTFYQRAGKRILDVLCAAVGLVLLAPLFPILAALLKLTSPGPVFFIQPRVGREGKFFLLMKFRSMRATREFGPSVTVSGDPRITSVGAILRRFKMDELPQLWNVLKGEMSLVGPRPEVEEYVMEYTPSQRQVLAVRPGITDPASIAYRHEEELLSSVLDPERYYRTIVLPQKLLLNLQYADNISFRRDVALILKTIRSILF
ncbi:MAG TPA: sugar transferase [Candidatus Acidoferrales bacterium]|nr:sugar transferase [Candidatus Acidoferrales bacterium]